MSTADNFVDWGGEFHQPAYQANDGIPIDVGVTTVWDVLISSAIQPPLKPTATGQGANLYVTSIGGVAQNASTGYYWVYFVNGSEPNVGAGAYLVQPGDSIAWDYKHFSSGHKQATHPGFGPTAKDTANS